MDETTRATEPLDPPNTPAQDADDPGPEGLVPEEFVPEASVAEESVAEDRFPEDLGAGPERGRSPGRERDQLLNGPALFPGDAGQLPLPLRQVLVRLLRGPYVDGSNADAGTGARAWRTIVEHRRALDIRLNELFLRLVIDEDRKIALLQPVEMAEPFTTALQRQRELSREETLLLLRMRLILDRQQGTGKESTIQRSEVLEIFAQYLQGASQDAKGVEELADQTIRRLVNDRRLLVATELPEVFVISNALPLALPFEQIGDIRNLLESIAHSPEPADGAESDDGDPGDAATTAATTPPSTAATTTATTTSAAPLLRTASPVPTASPTQTVPTASAASAASAIPAASPPTIPARKTRVTTCEHCRPAAPRGRDQPRSEPAQPSPAGQLGNLQRCPHHPCGPGRDAADR